jgi:hypothetical protein
MILFVSTSKNSPDLFMLSLAACHVRRVDIGQVEPLMPYHQGPRSVNSQVCELFISLDGPGSFAQERLAPPAVLHSSIIAWPALLHYVCKRAQTVSATANLCLHAHGLQLTYS